MCEPSLSLPAARASVPGAGVPSRRIGKTAAALLALLLAAGCATQSPVPSPGAGQAAAVASSPAPDAPTPVAPKPTLVPSPDRLATKLAAVSRAGVGASGLQVLAADGTPLAGRGATRPLAPASTMKLLTTLAAVDLLGADHRFSTRVVDAGSGRIVLVGGGDPLLTDKPSKSAAKPASLKALAAATASALAASGVERVSLSYDASLFSGPDFNPRWKSTWRSYLPRVRALLVGEGSFNKWAADPRPDRTAAKAFAARLEAAGIDVTLDGSAKAPAGAPELAAVQSAPLSVVVARTLRISDNLAAEVLARHVAIASSEPASFTGATTATRRWLEAHELWSQGMRLLDGSGLARDARVTPAVLARSIQLSLDTERLNAVAQGLPVAGESGTMKDRFDDKSEKVARGNVRAKTGTLVGVAALAGYLTTADGARLAFALMANRTAGQNTAYNWLDRSAAAMVRCGCS